VKAFAVWWTVGFIVCIALTGNGTVGVIGGIATWWVSVQIWWRTYCPRCDGSPQNFDWSTDKNWRPCPECGGRGWVPRMFAVGREP
jgi:DnaJ-class molecular chaperone